MRALPSTVAVVGTVAVILDAETLIGFAFSPTAAGGAGVAVTSTGAGGAGVAVVAGATVAADWFPVPTNCCQRCRHCRKFPSTVAGGAGVAIRSYQPLPVVPTLPALPSLLIGSTFPPTVAGGACGAITGICAVGAGFAVTSDWFHVRANRCRRCRHCRRCRPFPPTVAGDAGVAVTGVARHTKKFKHQAQRQNCTLNTVAPLSHNHYFLGGNNSL